MPSFSDKCWQIENDNLSNCHTSIMIAFRSLTFLQTKKYLLIVKMSLKSSTYGQCWFLLKKLFDNLFETACFAVLKRKKNAISMDWLPILQWHLLKCRLNVVRVEQVPLQKRNRCSPTKHYSCFARPCCLYRFC